MMMVLCDSIKRLFPDALCGRSQETNDVILH